MRYMILCCILLLTIACKQQEVPTYSGEDGIAFYIDRYESDSLNYSFAFSVEPINRDTIFLKMRVSGAAANHARTIKVKAGAGTTARLGIDYELPEIVLPAGALTVNYPVIVLNSPDMLNSTYRLVAEVAESSDFVLGATGVEIGTTTALKSMAINITNQLLEPTYWEEVVSAFGTFSVTKFKFMIQTTGLTDFSYDAIGVDGYYNMPVRLRNALEAYHAENGPLIDEYGEEVTF